MTSVDPEEAVTTANEGVTVEKSFEPDDFPVPAIAFRVRSERDQPAVVRLVDEIPDRVPPADIGFHPNFGAEYWEFDDGTIVFEREFAPGEEYTTVYGLRSGDAEEPDAFLGDPEVGVVDTEAADDSSQIVRDVIDGIDDSDGDDESDATPPSPGTPEKSGPPELSLDLPDPAVGSEPEGNASVDTTGFGVDESAADGSDVDEPDVDQSGVDRSDVDGSKGSSESTSNVADGGVDADSTGSKPTSPSTDDGHLLERLAVEIRSADDADDDVAELRAALERESATTSVEARLDHLQSTVSDFEAYTGALEAFLDENGDAERLIKEFKQEVSATNDRLDRIEHTAEEAVERADALDARLDAELEDIDRRLETIEERVEESIERVDAASSAATEANTGVESVCEDLETLESDVEGMTDERIADLESEIEDLSTELATLAAMRDRLASALGGLEPASENVR